MRTLFIHGAGGFDEDRPLAAAFGAHASMPRMSDEDMSFESCAGTLRPALTELDDGDLVIAHSFGGSILLLMLTEDAWARFDVHMLAMPNWRPKGWAIADYEFAGPVPPQSITLHHCADDDVVPHSHLGLNSALLPHAPVASYSSGGHQFDGRHDELRAALTH